MIKAVSKTNACESSPCATQALMPRHFSKAHGQLYVFKDRHRRDQIECLKDHCDSTAAISRELLARHAGEIASSHCNRSCCRGVESGDKVKQGRLARSRGSQQSHELAGEYRKA